MAKVSFSIVCMNCTQMTFDFSNTLRGDYPNIKPADYNYIIDWDGNIIAAEKQRTSDVKICVVGGINTHIHKKDKFPNIEYYLTPGQRKTLHNLIGYYGVVAKFTGVIGSGNSSQLNSVCNTLFENARG